MTENTEQGTKIDAGETGETSEADEADEAASRVPPGSLDDVPGWFHEVDQHLFHWFLNRQEESKTPGDLVELGVYLGKSTILIGEHQRPDDTFVVCDLFGAPAPDDDNDAESTKSYKDLTREEFEFNYRAFHDELPVVVQAPTGMILDHVRPDSCRFVHVDASHLYRHVRVDVQTARTMLNDDGIVVFDDYRSPHTPGVSAAVWEAVLTLGLKPVALSPQKFYGTWGDAESTRRELIAWTTERPGFTADVQEVSGHELVRVVYKPPKKTKPKPAPKPADDVKAAQGAQAGAVPAQGTGGATGGPAQQGAGGSTQKSPGDGKAAQGGQGGAAQGGTAKPKPPAKKGPPPSPARKLARDLLPPIITRTIRKARKANQANKPPKPPGQADSAQGDQGQNPA